MFATVKNKTTAKEFIALLTHIVSGTQSAAGFAYAPKDVAEKLAKAEPTFITLDASVTNDTGQIKAVANQAGIEAIGAAPAAETPDAAGTEAAVLTAKATPIYTMSDDYEDLPSINRGGGNKSDAYPFDQLEAPKVDNGVTKYRSFFVPSSESRPKPAKALASTVASATKRYKSATPPRVFTVRKVLKDGVEVGAKVYRIA